MSTLNQQIDVYCERTDFTFWSEPLNALTNFAFILAGLYAIRLYRRAGGRDGYALAMIISLFAVGTGSFLFHTFATRWAGLIDVLPIGFLIFTYHVATMHRIAGWPLWAAVASLIVIPALGWIAYQLPLGFMGSTKAYSPILVLLTIYFYYHWRWGGGRLFLLPAALAVFAASMAVRIADNHICDVFSHGVHWGWHILNATALALAFKAYITNRRHTP